MKPTTSSTTTSPLSSSSPSPSPSPSPSLGVTTKESAKNRKSRERRKLDRSALAKLHDIVLSDNEIEVEFGEGPLGLQILDVPERGVLVWHLDGQALQCSELKIGSQVVSVAGHSCSGLRMEQVFDLVSKEARPMSIRFRLPALVSNGRVDNGTTATLKPVDKTIKNRLRKFSVDGATGLTLAEDGKKNDTVRVVFQKGPLGLQISDVGKRVLVTSFENNPDGSIGQAEASGLIHFGSQIVRVGQEDCEGMSMHQIGMLVAKHKRPVVIEFRKLYEKQRPEPARAQRKKADDEAPVSPPAPPVVDLKRCECSKRAREAAQLDVDPMYFHFQMLCKSSQIRILLDYEESTAQQTAEEAAKHSAFELSSLHMPTLYRKVVKAGVVFADWPSWIREKYIEAYLLERRRRRATSESEKAQTDNASQAGEESSSQESDERCDFCKAQAALRDDAERLDDEMFIHFCLLYRTIKIQAERDKVDQQPYLDYLDEIDVELLYGSCQQDGISMHQWMDWIKRQCVWGYEEQLYKVALSGDTEIDLRDMIKDNKVV